MNRALSQLRRRYGHVPVVHPTLADADFPALRNNRRSEVAMAIRRPNGGILLQTKAFYPPKTYRLPTGGIKEGEDVEHALFREVDEESNLQVEVERVVAMIEHVMPDGRSPFRTYLFLLRETGGELRVNDPAEQISGWEARDAEGLRRAVAHLKALGGSWSRWGRFRAVSLEVLLDGLG